MSWSQAQQDSATQQMLGYIQETNTAFEAWYNSLQSGQQNQSQAALEEVLRRWRASLAQLRATSDGLMMNEGELDALGAIIREVSDLQSTLQKLQSENGTRTDQAVSVNPKVVPSPYTNILWLNRTFRSSTRTALLIATIVFAVLAFGVAGYIIYRFVTEGFAAAPASYPGQSGGGTRRH